MFATVSSLTKAETMFLTILPNPSPELPQKIDLYFFLIVKEQPILLLTKKTRTQATAPTRYLLFYLFACAPLTSANFAPLLSLSSVL